MLGFQNLDVSVVSVILITIILCIVGIFTTYKSAENNVKVITGSDGEDNKKSNNVGFFKWISDNIVVVGLFILSILYIFVKAFSSAIDTANKKKEAINKVKDIKKTVDEATDKVKDKVVDIKEEVSDINDKVVENNDIIDTVKEKLNSVSTVIDIEKDKIHDKIKAAGFTEVKSE